MALTKIPSNTQLVDGEFIQVAGPDSLISGFQYDQAQQALYIKESQIIFPSHHGITHIGEDPIPVATCDSIGLMSADDKCKLDAVTQTRLGILGFLGAGFPDDGGWMSGDLILAAGTDFISLEKLGNIIRFTVDIALPWVCDCNTCTQIYWMQDPSAPSAICAPPCSGVLPNTNLYGELKIFLFPESTIVDPANPVPTLNNKGNYPSLVFTRYNNSITPGQGYFEAVLQRNANNQSVSQVGMAMSPGSTGIAEMVWFMGLDDNGNLLQFDLGVDTTPGILGSLLFNGHLLTKQMSVVIDYTNTVLTNNQYVCQFWDVLNAVPVGDTFTATNIWRYVNPGSTPGNVNAPKALVLDISLDILPIGTLVDIWRFQIGEIGGSPVYRYFFKEPPITNIANAWTMVGGVEFGDMAEVRDETDKGRNINLAHVSSDIVDFEQTIWGLTGYDVPVMVYQDVANLGTSGTTLNIQHLAVIDDTIPGLVVNQDVGTEPFSQRPVLLWCRSGLEGSMLVKAEIGLPTDNMFPPYDILLQAPIDSYNNIYMKVVGTGTVNGVNYVRVKGVSFNDLPKSGTVRTINSNSGNRNKVFNFHNKLLFPSIDDDSIALIASANNNKAFEGSTNDIVELLHREFSAPCVRTHFINNVDNSISLQFEVGILGMDRPYEYNVTSDIDDLVRGMEPGYVVSAIYEQDSSWSGVGAGPGNNVDGFHIYTGGLASDNNEYWNVLEIMLRQGQIWIWWNGLLIPPNSTLSNLLPTPVSINTPYFPITTNMIIGKYGIRLWPGSKLRRTSVRTQPRSFSEMSYGQLILA